MTNGQHRWLRGLTRLLREPTIHFFFLGALFFLVHRAVVGDPRLIVVSGGLRADLERRLRDQTGRRPTPGEMEAALDGWKRDEALYREALRERLDRDDPAVRTVLADKMRARAVQEMPRHEPTDAELQGILAVRRESYEAPLRYDFESVAFAKTEASAEAQRSGYQRALAAGGEAAKLGHPLVSGTLARDDLARKFGPVVAEQIGKLPIGKWQPLESEASLLLVRLNKIEGGLPTWDVLRPRLTSDWEGLMKQQAVDRVVESVTRRYRFEDGR
jgi:hypothetical protein